MSEPTSKAIVSIGSSAGCAAIAFASPMFAATSIVDIVISMFLI
jgi:hypothetical protein